MDGQFLKGIELVIQIVWVLQVINVNVHKKMNIHIASLFLVLFNLTIMFNVSSISKVSILLHIINLFAVFFIYKEDSNKAIVSFAFAYLSVLIFDFLEANYLFVRIAEIIFRVKSLAQYYYIINLDAFIILVAVSRAALIYMKKSIHLISENIVSTVSLIISGFFLDIIMVNVMNKNVNINMVILINKVMIINIFLFTLAVIYTTIKFDNKLDKMGELNDALENKNGQLRKIKHDYGAQISYLYGLYLLKRYDDLGKALKDICKRNNEVSSAVSIRSNENSIIYKALKPALERGIHILLEENIESNIIDISEDNLFIILSVIRNNALKYMDNEGMIIVKVYEAFGNAIIDIENSCTCNKKMHIGILKNSYLNFIDGWEDFYSLNGIKKLIEENNGQIYIKNKDISTCVRISIPTIIDYSEELQ